MPHDPRKHGSGDRTRINVHEPYELDYWSKKFGISHDRLKELLKEHGVMVRDIE